jgi:hypothetical protein
VLILSTHTLDSSVLRNPVFRQTGHVTFRR